MYATDDKILFILGKFYEQDSGLNQWLDGDRVKRKNIEAKVSRN